MALNKSNRSTPSSRSGYFCELTASAGKQSNFLFPVRIKITPNNTIGSLSDGKKNYTKISQPVLIKDLLQSNQTERQHTKIISVSTQKKKFPQQSLQSYLGRQSCYNPKKVEDSSCFNRKSYDGSKVRRQLYQTLDYSQKKKSVFDGKENTNKVPIIKKKSVQNSQEETIQDTVIRNKNRQSYLLPLNTIKNSFIRKSSNQINADKRNINNNTMGCVNKKKKHPSKITEIKKLKTNDQRNTYIETQDEVNMELNASSFVFNKDNNNQSCFAVQDKCTMTSPCIDKNLPLNKSLSISEFEKKNFLIDSLKLTSEAKQNTELYFPSINSLEYSSFTDLKLFLEQSIKASENQTFQLKQALHFVNNMFCSTIKTDTHFNDNIDNNGSIPNILINNQSGSNAINLINTNLKNKNITDNKSTLTINADEMECIEDSNLNIEETLLTSIKTLFSNEELNKVKKNSMETENDPVRLSTIGETSCEVDELNKDENVEYKEYINDFEVISPSSPKSLPNRSVEDSFILLENELNVQHTILPSKSLPASPTKYTTLPTIAKQWDKKVQRPLKEYMDLKMNGTFLVTPDVKRFQSCLEPTDTPHSRKSLSRKIFMELCDLYAESPEPK